MVDRKKLVENSLKHLKSGSWWGKLTGILTALVLVVQAYYDVRADIRDAQAEAEEAQEEVDEAEEQLKSKGKLSEQTTAEAITEMQETMQFIYEEGVLLVDRVEDLELENKRLRARLDRYRDLSGLPAEVTEEDLQYLAAKLLPFLVDPDDEGVGGGGVGMGMGDTAMVVMSDDPEMDVEVEDFVEEEDASDFVDEERKPVAKSKRKKKADHLDEAGNLKFDKGPAKAW